MGTGFGLEEAGEEVVRARRENGQAEGRKYRIKGEKGVGL